MRRLELLLARAEADARAARLVVGRVRARRDLAIPLLRREPRLDVVALRRRGREVARRAVDDAVGQPDLLDERLLEREQPLVLVPRLLRADVDDHLDLLELVHAEHAARVAARRARLAAEARRERAVADRQLLEDLAHMHRDQRHLGRPDEVEPVLGDRVVVVLLGREEPGAVHRLLAHEHRRQDGREPALRQAVEREAVERQREPSRVADDEPEARARDLGAALHVVARKLEVLRRVLRRLRLAPLLDDDRVLVAVTVGG